MENDNKMMPLVKRRERQILSAAQTIFAHNGYRRTKIDDITEHLSIGKGTIYRYFKDKKSLFLAVYEHGMRHLQMTMRENVDPIENPQKKVSAAISTFFSFFDQHRELIEIQMQVRSEFKEDYRRVSLALYADYIVRIQDNLRNGIKMGFFRDLDVEKTAETISATLHGVLQSFYIREFSSEGQQKQSLTDRTDAVTALLLEGLLKR